MTINKYKLQFIGTFVLVLTSLGQKVLCQTYPVIDLDKANFIKLPEKPKEENIPGGTPKFNDILKVKAKSITPYVIDYINASQFPIILDGAVYLNLNDKLMAFNLEIAKSSVMSIFKCRIKSM